MAIAVGCDKKNLYISLATYGLYPAYIKAQAKGPKGLIFLTWTTWSVSQKSFALYYGVGMLIPISVRWVIGVSCSFWKDDGSNYYTKSPANVTEWWLWVREESRSPTCHHFELWQRYIYKIYLISITVAIGQVMSLLPSGRQFNPGMQ